MRFPGNADRKATLVRGRTNHDYDQGLLSFHITTTSLIFRVQMKQNKRPPIPPDVILSDLAMNFQDLCFAMRVFSYG
jgi:metal-dependent HD superfamily phosphatase/phosphodiesterase